MQVLEPHTLHAGTHEGKACFLIIYILIHIQRKSFVFGSTKDDHLVVNMVVNLL